MNSENFLSIVVQVIAYIFAVIVIIQILRYIFGVTWVIEDIILALVIFNLTVTFGVGGYLISLNNKIASVDKKIHGHFEWHRGKKR